MARNGTLPSSSSGPGPRGRGGFLLPLTLLLLTLGMLAVTPLAGLVGAVVRRAGGGAEADLARLTAESAVYRVAADLALGRPVGEPGGPPLTLSLNGLTARVTVEPLPWPGPPAEPVYTPLAEGPLRRGQAALRTLTGVEPFTPLRVRAQAEPAVPLRLQVYRGPGPAGPPLAEAEGEGTVELTLPGWRVEGGTYTLAVWNEGRRTARLLPFSPGGAGTWVLLTAREDFRVTARAGRVEVTALLRRLPGPRRDRWAVRVLAWQESTRQLP